MPGRPSGFPAKPVDPEPSRAPRPRGYRIFRRMSLLPVRPRRIIALASITTLVLLFAGFTGREEARYGPHTADELRSFRDTIQGLEVQFGPYFVTAGRCAGCHGFDSLGMAMVDL